MASTKFEGDFGPSTFPARDTFGVWGDSARGYGIIGTSKSSGRAGVFGEGSGSDSGGLLDPCAGVEGRAPRGQGVRGTCNEGIGVLGQGKDGLWGIGSVTGVRGYAYGRGGFNVDSALVGQGFGAGLYTANTAGPWKYEVFLSLNGCAGLFFGPISGTDSFNSAGAGFLVDHPLDPANKYLSHSSVESPERKTVYDGIAVLDGNGEALVELPEWFGVLNRDFRYQLTCLGGHAPVFVAQKIQGNRFHIAGGVPGLEVSWQVTGVRQDPWANANPLTVETEKPEKERGSFLHPDLYGQPEEKGLQRALLPQPPELPQLKDLSQQEE